MAKNLRPWRSPTSGPNKRLLLDSTSFLSRRRKGVALSLEQKHRRPWPVPDWPWAVRQTWHDLLFAHWPVSPARVAAHLPDGLQLDLYKGQAWLGVVPFYLTGMRLRGTFPLPILSSFP